MTDDEALKLAITFESEYPEVFKDLEKVLMLPGTAMSVTRRIQDVTHLSFPTSALVRAALRLVGAKTEVPE